MPQFPWTSPPACAFKACADEQRAELCKATGNVCHRARKSRDFVRLPRRYFKEHTPTVTLSFAFLFPEGKDVPWAATVKPMGMAMLGGHGRRRRLAAASAGCLAAPGQLSSGCLPVASNQQPVAWGRAVVTRASQDPAASGRRDGRPLPASAARRWRAVARTAMTP